MNPRQTTGRCRSHVILTDTRSVQIPSPASPGSPGPDTELQLGHFSPWVDSSLAFKYAVPLDADLAFRTVPDVPLPREQLEELQDRVRPMLSY